MSQTTDQSEFEIKTFQYSHETLGIVLDFVANKKPFGAFEIEVLFNGIKRQLQHGHNVYATCDDKLVGYCGWLLTSREIGEKWLETESGLVPVPENIADAGALTVVIAEDTPVLLGLIRASRQLNPGKRVFFKRDYADSRRKSRRQTVPS